MRRTFGISLLSLIYIPREFTDQKSITCLASLKGSNTTTLYSGSYDGRCNSFDASTGSCTPIQGAGHANQITAIQPASSDSVCSIAMDDTLRYVDSKGPQFQYVVFRRLACPVLIAN